MKTRASGLLLHISSLPSEYGIGDFGPKAYEFADFLSQAGQRYWQVLPLNPIDSKSRYCPYDCLSAFAGNILFISPDLMVEEGFLNKKDILGKPVFPKGKVNFRMVTSYKTKILNIAFKNFKNTSPQKKYQKFCSDNSWLEDYALFSALGSKFHNHQWNSWPKEIKGREKKTLELLKVQLVGLIEKEKFRQYLFFSQWYNLKNYCNRLGIKIIGDIPIYVSQDSADVWAHPEFFKLTKTKKPRFIAGVPPDFFSRSGQLWGNPVYDWKTLKKTGYQWWLQRIGQNLTLFDIVRLDHFRGFVAYWQVPAGSKTAKNGKWIKGPEEDFLSKLFRRFPKSCFIAEDLGYITKDVRALIKKYNLTSMKVLMFGFGKKPSENVHCPDNYVRNSVVYTGTHDNNTVKGWFRNEATPKQKKRLIDYIGHKVSLSQVSWEFIKLAMNSASDTAIIPMQDVLGLDQSARMNKPSTLSNNWRWRLVSQKMNKVCLKLAKINREYGRT